MEHFLRAENPSFFAAGEIFRSNQQTSFPLSQLQCVRIPRKTQVHKSIRCARNRRGKYGSARSGKLVLESAYHIASKLKILPEPLDILVKQFCVGEGNGGGSGFWNGSKWVGFDGWGRRRRRRIGKMELLGILVILGLGLWLILGREVSEGVFLGVLGLVLFGLSIDGWRRGVKDWVLGFSSCAFSVGLVLEKKDFQKLVNNFEALRKLMVRERRSRAF